MNLPAFLSVNACDAGIVTDVKRTGDTFTIEYKYYLIDYYDFEENPEDITYLNYYGLSAEYITYGCCESSTKWEKGDDLEIVVTKELLNVIGGM